MFLDRTNPAIAHSGDMPSNLRVLVNTGDTLAMQRCSL